jgi:hypothetical protein
LAPGLEINLCFCDALKMKVKVTMPTVEPKALSQRKFARKHGVHPVTVWRAVRDGRLKYVVIGRRKLILEPEVQRAESERAFPVSVPSPFPALAEKPRRR